MNTIRYTNGSVKYPECTQKFASKFREGGVKSPPISGGGGQILEVNLEGGVKIQG